MEEKKNQPTNAQNELTAIVVKTITRNAKDSEQEFLAKLGASEGLKEKNVVNSMIFNALTEITKQLLSIETTINQTTGFFTLMLKEDELLQLKENTKKGE